MKIISSLHFFDIQYETNSAISVKLDQQRQQTYRNTESLFSKQIQINLATFVVSKDIGRVQ